jgi:UrcA family protein
VAVAAARLVVAAAAAVAAAGKFHAEPSQLFLCSPVDPTPHSRAGTLETSPVKTPALWIAASAIALSTFAAPAFAQKYNDQYTYDDEITVVAPEVYRERTGRSTSGIPIEELSVQRVVDSSDLNLRRNADVYELYRRIEYTAREACNEIMRASRGAPITTQRECVREATRDAMAEADALIYARRS